MTNRRGKTSAKECVTAAPSVSPSRVLRFRDLVLYYVVTGVSLRWIALAASIGPSALLMWVVAWLLFYVPLVLAVGELSSRCPSEGGLYVWTTKAFGQPIGFLAGWMYWTSNLPYFPGVLYFAASNILYIHPSCHAWSRTPTYFVTFSIVMLIAITAMNIAGLSLAKWIHNFGAVAMWVPVVMLTMMGVIALIRFGSATSFRVHIAQTGISVQTITLWAGLVFAFGGCETGSFFAAEIQQPERNIPRALLVAGLSISLCYVLGTASVLVALSRNQVSSLDGLVQALQRTAELIGLSGITPVFAILVAVSNVAAAAAYLAAASRLPFVAGMEGLLPRSLAKVHPRSGAPHISLLAQGIVAIVFVLLGQVGTSVKGAYEVLVDISVITYLIPYLFVFAAFIKLQQQILDRPVFRIPGGKLGRYLVAATGMLSTFAAICAAVVPSGDEPHKGIAAIKIIGSTGALVGVGLVMYWVRTKRTHTL